MLPGINSVTTKDEASTPAARAKSATSIASNEALLEEPAMPAVFLHRYIIHGQVTCIYVVGFNASHTYMCRRAQCK